MSDPAQQVPLGSSWRYVLAGQAVGPVDENSLLQLAATGQVRPETLVWADGMPEWVPAYSVERFAHAFEHASRAGIAAAPPVVAGPMVNGRGETEYLGTNYAGFMVRFIAWVLDMIIVTLLAAATYFGCMALAALFSSIPLVRTLAVAPICFMFIGPSLVYWLYFAMLESSPSQATLGKQLMGLRIITTSGRRMTFAHATGRFLAKMITNMTFLIGYIIAAFTEKKQALHDMIAGTLVVSR